MWFQDEIVARIEERISAWTFLPAGATFIILLSLSKLVIAFCLTSYHLCGVWCYFFNASGGLENSKPLNILNFGPEDNKQKYDFFGNQSKLLLSEPTVATVILYLSNVSQGGQILFPESDVRKAVSDLFVFAHSQP